MPELPPWAITVTAWLIVVCGWLVVASGVAWVLTSALRRVLIHLSLWRDFLLWAHQLRAAELRRYSQPRRTDA